MNLQSLGLRGGSQRIGLCAFLLGRAEYGRYFVTALSNEDKISDFKIDFKDDYFSPNNLAHKSQTK